MHKSGRTMPSAQGFTGHPATRDSVLKPWLLRQLISAVFLLADAIEEALHRVHPAACTWVVSLAAGAHGFIKLL